jgi:hypothetical protein
MAGLGWRSFTAGAVLTAAQVQTYLQDQTVQVHASAAARTATLGTAVSTGMVSYRTDGTAVEFYNGTAWVGLDSASTVLANRTLSGQTVENFYTTATGFAGYTFYVTTNGAIQYITANATANGTVNIAASSTVALNTLLGVNQAITVVLQVTNGASAFYPTAWQIDGVAVTPKWVGTAPTAGNASAIDMYTVTIQKTASATYTVTAQQTKVA